MSAQLMPSKRQHEGSPSEANGRKKLHKSSALSSENSLASISIRILYPASRIGEVLGNGGDALSQICQETGAQVYVEDYVPDCEERVVVIAGLNKDNQIDETKQVKLVEKNIKAPESAEGPLNDEEIEQDKQSVQVDDCETEKETDISPIQLANSSVQKALLIVFEKLIGGVTEAREGDEATSPPVVRLLIFSSEVGSLVGKFDSLFKQISSESGAEIDIFPKDKLPSCASSSDELVQISGGLESIRKALQPVSEKLLENCRQEQGPSSSENDVGQSTHTGSRPHKRDRFPSLTRARGNGGPSYSSGKNFPPANVVTFRLLCTKEKIGAVIGKGGSLVRAIERETGCEINIVDSGANSSEDRMIVISGPAHPDDVTSPPQDALLRVQTIMLSVDPETNENNLTRLVVSSNQIGCLLGKAGAVITGIRKSTGANIRIVGKDKAPSCPENEELVLVNGEPKKVKKALVQITTKLRNNFLSDGFRPGGRQANLAFLDQMHPYPPVRGRREFSPPGAFSNQGPPFNKFDGPGRLPSGPGFFSHDDQPPFAPEYLRQGIPPHISERMPWGPHQGPMEGHGPTGFPDYPGGPPRRMNGFAGGNVGIITSTTVEVVVPSFVVPAIYGEGGGCLQQILEISEAKITITDPKPGATETAIIIFGTPEETNAAQSLIQAFVISETEGSNR